MVISLRPIQSAISSYKPMICRTQPRPKKTTTGIPVGHPKSERLTVNGLSCDAWGERVSLSSVVNLEERRYCATAWDGVGLTILTKLAVSKGEFDI